MASTRTMYASTTMSVMTRTRRLLLGTAGATAALVAALAGAHVTLAATRPTAASAATVAPPNIVFVLTDDLSWNLIKYLPQVQKLQTQGMTFNDYVVTDSLCCPSRSSIFSGRFPHDTGVFTNGGNDGGFDYFHGHGEEAHTFATALQAKGYRTAMMGKYLNGYEPANTEGGTLPYVPPGWSEWDVAGNGYPELNYDLNQNHTVVHYGSRPHPVDGGREAEHRHLVPQARAGGPGRRQAHRYAAGGADQRRGRRQHLRGVQLRQRVPHGRVPAEPGEDDRVRHRHPGTAGGGRAGHRGRPVEHLGGGQHRPRPDVPATGRRPDRVHCGRTQPASVAARRIRRQLAYGQPGRAPRTGHHGGRPGHAGAQQWQPAELRGDPYARVHLRRVRRRLEGVLRPRERSERTAQHRGYPDPGPVGATAHRADQPGELPQRYRLLVRRPRLTRR